MSRKKKTKEKKKHDHLGMKEHNLHNHDYKRDYIEKHIKSSLISALESWNVLCQNDEKAIDKHYRELEQLTTMLFLVHATTNNATINATTFAN